jgi:hypothetical protein
MAYLLRGYEDERTPIQHSTDIFKEHLRSFELNKLLGKKDSGMPIITDSKIKGNAGDTIVYHFIPQNKTDGIYGQEATMIGHEETLDEYLDKITIDQVRKGFKKKGKLTDKRLVWDARAEFKKQLANWFADQNNVWVHAALSGYCKDGFNILKGEEKANTPLVNGKGRCVAANKTSKFKLVAPEQTSDNGVLTQLTNADIINTYLLDELSIIAKQGNSKYRIAPVRMSNGKEMFFFIVDMKTARDLRQDARFDKHALSLVEAGISPEKDPYVSGAIGIWQNLIIMESEYISHVKNDSVDVARNLLLGANACAMIWAQTTDYKEEKFDYENQLGVTADEIRGQKKLTFDGVDVGVMQVLTAVN